MMITAVIKIKVEIFSVKQTIAMHFISSSITTTTIITFETLPIDAILHIYTFLSVDISNYVRFMIDIKKQFLQYYQRHGDPLLHTLFGYFSFDSKRTVHKLYVHVIFECTQPHIAPASLFIENQFLNPYSFVTLFSQELQNFDKIIQSADGLFNYVTNAFLDYAFIPHLNECTKLEQIQLRPDPVEAPKIMEQIISKNTKLQVIRSNCNISETLMKVPLNHMKELSLALSELTDNDLLIIGIHLKYLRKLIIPYNDVLLSDARLDNIEFNYLHYLSICGNDISVEGTKLLSKLFPKLTSLTITYYSDETVKASLTLPNLYELSIIGGLTDAFPSYSYITENQTIRKLEISSINGDLHDSFAEKLSQNMYITNLDLDISPEFSSTVFGENCRLQLKQLKCGFIDSFCDKLVKTQGRYLEELYLPCLQETLYDSYFTNLKNLHITYFKLDQVEYIHDIQCKKHIYLLDRLNLITIGKLLLIPNIASLEMKFPVGNRVLDQLINKLCEEPSFERLVIPFQDLSPGQILWFCKSDHLFTSKYQFSPIVTTYK
jgi:hypothetical protein